MTRNSRKLQRSPQPDYDPNTEQVKVKSQAQNKNANSANPFGMSFVVSTAKVELPTKGLFYPRGSSMHGIEELEIKHMTAKEEDLLSTVGSGADENVFNNLISGLLTDKTIDPSELLDEDKMAILLKARETGYGNEYESTIFCENCNSETSAVFDLSKAKVTSIAEENQYDPDEDCFVLTLPISDIEVKIRRITEKDRTEIDQDKEKKESLNIEFNRTISILKKTIISANGIVDQATLSKLYNVLPAADAKFLLNFDKDIIPKLSTAQNVECSKCATVLEREAPLSWAFFRTDI